MASYTVRLHRVLRAKPERVYRAMLDADALVKWLPPHGYTAHVQEFNPTPGGSYHMSFTNFATGESHSFGGVYDELVPNKLLRYRDKFDDPNLPGEMQVTVTLVDVGSGTDLTVVQEGIPDIIPEDGCYVGWQQSLQLLAQLVEAEFPE